MALLFISVIIIIQIIIMIKIIILSADATKQCKQTEQTYKEINQRLDQLKERGLYDAKHF